MTTVQFNSKEPIKLENLMYVPFGEILAMLKNGYKIEGINIAANVENIETQSIRQIDEKTEDKTTQKTVKKREKTEKKQPKKVAEKKKIEKNYDIKVLKTKKQKSSKLF